MSRLHWLWLIHGWDLFTMKANPVDISEKNIDPFLFRDDDGKYYLYHVRFNRGI